MSFLVLVVDDEPDVEMLFRQEESLGRRRGGASHQAYQFCGASH